jgi:hypothetical protein
MSLDNDKLLRVNPQRQLKNTHKTAEGKLYVPPHHELISLLRFSLRFNLSTLFLCIFSAIFSYRSFSSLATRFSFSAVMRLCIRKTDQPTALMPTPR